jgi:hypothetical protein
MNSKKITQAHGTPLTPGQVPHEILTGNTYVDMVLQSMAAMKNLPEIDTYISSDEVERGFKKWKEATSTSPSGCHLGLRRFQQSPSMEKNSTKRDKLYSRYKH